MRLKSNLSILSLIIGVLFSSNVLATVITSVQSGDWEDVNTWDCVCNPAGSSSDRDTIIIDINDTVTAQSGNKYMSRFEIRSGALYVANVASTHCYGDYIIDGRHEGSNTLRLRGMGTLIGGSGEIATTRRIQIRDGDKEIQSSADITRSGPNDILIFSGITVTNKGKFTINDNISGLATSSTWINDVDASLVIAGDLFPGDGTFVGDSSGNTVTYNGALIQSGADGVYYNLLSSGTSVSFNSSGNTVRVKNTFSITAGTVTFSDINVNIEDTFTVNGSVIFDNASGDKSFDDIVINSSGSWSANTINDTFLINGFIDNNGGSFVAGSSSAPENQYILEGSSKTISSSSLLTFQNVIIRGTYTNSDSIEIEGVLNGDGGSLTQGVNSVLMLGDDFMGTLTTDFTSNANTVIYNGASNQSAIEVSYDNVVINSTGGAVNFDNSGATFSTNNLTVTQGTVTFSDVNVNVSGTTSITGMIAINSASGNRSFNDININTGGEWNVSVDDSIEITGSVDNDGVFTASATNGTASDYLFSGSAKMLSGDRNISIPNARITGTYTNSDSLEISNMFSGSGTLIQGSNSVLQIGGAISGLITDFSTNLNTVAYNGASDQDITNTDYYHLNISGTGIKTLTSNLSLLGSMVINGNLDVSASNRNIDIKGNWIKTSGSFNERSATVDFSGATQSIASDTFNNVTINSSATVALAGNIVINGTLEIGSGTLDVSESNYNMEVKGDFYQGDGFNARQGKVTLNGDSQQFTEEEIVFYDLEIDNLNDVEATFGLISVGNVLTLTNGNFDVSINGLLLLSTASGTAIVDASVGVGTISGDVTMQQYVSGSIGYRYFGVPVSGQTLANHMDDYNMYGFTGVPTMNDPTGANGWQSVYTYDEDSLLDSEVGWVSATNTTNPMSVGTGYSAYIYDTDLPTTVDVTGEVTFNNHDFGVTYTMSDSGINHDGWNFIGNPYPSVLDWSNATGWSRTNMDSAVYIYRSDLEQYASWIDGVATNGGSNLISPSQGFFVKANAAAPALEVNRNATGSAPISFLKDGEIISSIYRLKLLDLNQNMKDELVVRVKEGTKDEFEGSADAYKLLNGEGQPNFYSYSKDNMRCAINTFPKITGQTRVPILLSVTATANYNIVGEFTDIDEEGCVFLIDKKLGKTIDIRNNSYSFAASPEDDINRFELNFGTTEANLTATEETYTITNGISVEAQFENNSLGADAYLWDFGDGSIEYSNNAEVTHDFEEEGVYTVMLVAFNSNCGTTDTSYQTVTVNKTTVGVDLSAENAFIVYPNPIKQDLFIVNKIKTEVNQVTITNIMGQKVLEHNNAFNGKKLQLDVSEVPSGIYSIEVHTEDGTYQYKMTKE